MKSLSFVLLTLLLSAGLLAGCSEKKEAPAEESMVKEAPEKKEAAEAGQSVPAAPADAPTAEAETASVPPSVKEAPPGEAAPSKKAASPAPGKTAGTAPAAPAGSRIDAGPVYRAMCAACHGAEAQGSAIAPAFKSNEWVRDASPEEIASVIRDGRTGAAKRHRNFPMGMPPQKALSDDQVDALVGYLKDLSSR